MFETMLIVGILAVMTGVAIGIFARRPHQGRAVVVTFVGIALLVVAAIGLQFRDPPEAEVLLAEPSVLEEPEVVLVPEEPVGLGRTAGELVLALDALDLGMTFREEVDAFGERVLLGETDGLLVQMTPMPTGELAAVSLVTVRPLESAEALQAAMATAVLLTAVAPGLDPGWPARALRSGRTETKAAAPGRSVTFRNYLGSLGTTVLRVESAAR